MLEHDEETLNAGSIIDQDKKVISSSKKGKVGSNFEKKLRNRKSKHNKLETEEESSLSSKYVIAPLNFLIRYCFRISFKTRIYGTIREV